VVSSDRLAVCDLRKDRFSHERNRRSYLLYNLYLVRYTWDMSRAGELIREARSRAGLTQTELAALAATSQPTVAAYESGTKVPSTDTLERILKATGLSLSAVPVARSRRASRLRQRLQKHRGEILELAAQHGARNVRVFGSVARGQDSRGSDLDLLVDMEPKRSLLDVVRLRRALNELLAVEVDVLTTGALRDSDSGIVADAVSL
jgi:predicted nucleotidyltransferase/DNA-binding XRE family transcriptional regulator